MGREVLFSHARSGTDHSVILRFLCAASKLAWITWIMLQTGVSTQCCWKSKDFRSFLNSFRIKKPTKFNIVLSYMKMINWWPELKVKFRVWELTPKRRAVKIKAVETKLTSGIGQFKWFVQGYFGWQQSRRFALSIPEVWLMGFTQCPAWGGLDKGLKYVGVCGSRASRGSAGSCTAPSPAAVVPMWAVGARLLRSPFVTVWAIWRPAWFYIQCSDATGEKNLCCFHGSLCVGPWLERGSRMLSVPAVSDFSKPHQKKALTPTLPQTLLVISIGALWCIYCPKCSSRFLVITLLLRISTPAAALFWFSLLSAGSCCRALQDYPFKSCWEWHGQMQLVLGDWWPVKNGLRGSILSQAGRHKQPKQCQHQCLPLAALLKGHRDLLLPFFPQSGDSFNSDHTLRNSV